MGRLNKVNAHVPTTPALEKKSVKRHCTDLPTVELRWRLKTTNLFGGSGYRVGGARAKRIVIVKRFARSFRRVERQFEDAWSAGSR